MSYEMDRLIYGNEREAEGRAEGKAEGRAEGRAEGKQIQLFELVIKDLLPMSVAAKEAGLEQEEFEEALKEYKAQQATE